MSNTESQIQKSNNESLVLLAVITSLSRVCVSSDMWSLALSYATDHCKEIGVNEETANRVIKAIEEQRKRGRESSGLSSMMP
jgi:hypothetical protein